MNLSQASYLNDLPCFLQKRRGLSLFTILGCCFLFIGSISAGTPHSVLGVVEYTDDSKPVSLSYIAYITARPGDVLTQTSAGCGYDPVTGQWWVQCGTFSSPWAAGEVFRIEFDDGLGGTAFDEVPLTWNPWDAADTTVISQPDRPDIETSPISWNFGDIIVGSSSARTISVTNTGSADLMVTSTRLVGTDAGQFNINSGGGSFILVPGAARNVIVSFNPTTTGARTATLRFMNNDPDENPKDVTLNGNGTSVPSPDISVTPPLWNYGNIIVGTISIKTFTVTNEGTVNLNVTSTSLQGTDAIRFNIDSGGGGFTLTPGTTRDVAVSFNPIITGARSGTLRFVSNDPDETPKDVPLSGSGISMPVPDIAVTPVSWDFGNVAVGSTSSKTFIVSNTGSADLNVTSTSLVGTNADQFSITGGGGGYTLTPGTTRDVVVSYAPQSTGPMNATLRLMSNDPDDNPGDVPLLGNGTPMPVPDIAVTPTSWNYGNVTVGSGSSGTFTVTNEGSGDLTITSTSLVGTNPGQFDIDSGGGGYTLTPGASRNVVVRFHPSTTGAKAAALRLENNDSDENPVVVPLSGTGTLAPVPDIAVSPTSWNYGNVNVGSSTSFTVTVTNEGSANLNITSTGFVGTDAAQFTIVSGGGSTILGPGLSYDLVVRFTPTTIGARTGALRLLNNDPDENPKDVPLNGNGTPVPVPDIAVTPLSWNYGQIVIGSSASITFTVSNQGSENLSVTSTDLVGSDAGLFNIVSGGGSFTLTPGATRDIVINFAPSTTGFKTGTLRLTSNDPDENPRDVSLIGYGSQTAAPDIDVSPALKIFGNVPIGSNTLVFFSVKNEGTLGLEVTGTSLIGTNTDQFQIMSGGGAFSLAPGASRDVSVNFKPTGTGVLSAILRIVSNDPDENPKDVPLSGTGMAAGMTVNPSSWDFGNVEIGSHASKLFTLTNEGTANLVVTSTTMEGANADQFAIVVGGGAFVLFQGATRNIEVRFGPTTGGAKNAGLQLTSNDPNANKTEIALNGRGIVRNAEPPYLKHIFPAPGSSEVPKNTVIGFTVSGDGSEIDQSTLHVWVNAAGVILGGFGLLGGQVMVDPNTRNVIIRYDPLVDFNMGSTVTVQVQCEDFAFPVNEFDQTYSFGIGNETVTVTKVESVGRDGGVVLYETTDIQLTIPEGALSYDTQLTIGVVDDPPAMPENVIGFGVRYHFGPDGLQFNVPVRIRIPYTPSTLVGTGVDSPLDIPVYYYSTSNGEWIKLNIVNYSSKYIYVSVTEFCYLVLAREDSGHSPVEEGNNASYPIDITLNQNFPNPFNPETTIQVLLPHESSVRLIIYNMRGQRIRTLVDGVKPAGNHYVKWDGRQDSGDKAESGVYFVHLKTEKGSKIGKLILMR